MSDLQLLQLFQALAADVLPLVGDHIAGVVAEDAGGLILAQDDRVAIHIDLQGVALVNVQGAAQLDGKDDPTQFIDFSDNSGGFHVHFSFSQHFPFFPNAVTVSIIIHLQEMSRKIGKYL